MADPVPFNVPAIVTDDFGHRWQTHTRSGPWALGDGTVVQLIEGIAGGYLASRLERGEDPALPHFRDRNSIDRGPSPKPRLTAKQRQAKDRYGQWLSMDMNVSFADFLRWRMYEVPRG